LKTLGQTLQAWPSGAAVLVATFGTALAKLIIWLVPRLAGREVEGFSALVLVLVLV
jgi:high-affinity Fe2+/Pb2+ permease